MNHLSLLLCIFTSLFSLSLLANKNPPISVYANELRPQNYSSFLNIIPVKKEDQGKSLAALLSSEKSIHLKQLGGTGSLVSADIRGTGKAEHVLILIDGIRLNHGQGSGVDLSQIPVSMIEKIEIIRGGDSALYGSEALGGIINIVTKKNVSDLSYHASRHSWSKEGFQDHLFSLTYGKNFSPQLNMVAGIQSEKDNGAFHYKNPITRGPEKRDDNDFLAQNFFIKASANISKQWTLIWFQNFFQSKKANPSPLDNRGKVMPYVGHQQQQRTISEIEALYEISDDTNVTLTLPYTFSKLTYSDNSESTTYRNYFTGPHIKAQFPLSREHALTALLGTDTYYLKSHSHQKNRQKTNLGIAIKDDITLNHRSIISPALRVDTAKDLYTTFNPKLGFTYDITPMLKIKSNASKNFRAPAFDELYFHSDSPFFSYMGNPKLKPEGSFDFDIGINFDDTTWKAEQTLFVSSLNNVIVNQNIMKGTKMITAPQNNDKTTVWGMEASLEGPIPFMPNFSKQLGYTWLHSHLPYRPQHRFHSMIMWEKNNWRAFMDHHFTSQIKTSHPLREKLSPVFLMDMGATYKFSEMISLSVKIGNVLDKAYESMPYYPMPGRSFEMGISGTL